MDNIDMKKQEQEQEEWNSTWQEFVNALQDIDNSFDQLYWMKRLFMSGIRCLLYKTNSKYVTSVLWKNKGHFAQFIPLMGISLICVIILSHDLFLYEYILRYYSDKFKQWGRSWISIHLLLVHYLGFMILWNYIQTLFTSPGCVTPMSYRNSRDELQQKWKSSQGRGGLCYINPTFNMQRELHLVSLYSEAFGKECTSDMDSKFLFIPSANVTFCKKCQMDRPPRCHHCSTCDRCVLQMDHHCIWLNNCIGYNNYRTFLLTIFYLVAGCWYGITVLISPYYQLIRLNYTRNTDRYHLDISQSIFATIRDIVVHKQLGNILDIPTPMFLYNELRYNNYTIQPEIAIKAIFPLLVSVGIILTLFFKSHCRLVMKSLTTLEYIATLKFLKDQTLYQQQGNNVKKELSLGLDEMNVVNPFDQGIWRNIGTVLGPNLLYILLPIKVVPPPYIPACKDKTD